MGRALPTVRKRMVTAVAGDSMNTRRSVAGRITAILLALTEGSEHSLTELAQRTGLPLSTTHRLVAELTARGLLERTDASTYRAGLPLRTLGGGALSVPTVAERAPYVLEDLTLATGFRSRLGVLRDLEVGYIEKQPGHTPVTPFCSAASLPAHCTALGRMLLAFAPAAVVEMTILGSTRAGGRGIPSPSRFRRHWR